MKRGVRAGESSGGADGDDEAFVHIPQGTKYFIVCVVGRAQCLGKGLADQRVVSVHHWVSTVEPEVFWALRGQRWLLRLLLLLLSLLLCLWDGCARVTQ